MTPEAFGEHRHTHTLLVGERRVLELIATGASLSSVLDALCRVIDEESGLMSSIYLLDRAEARLTLAAGPHLPDVWAQWFRVFPATRTTTACGQAVTTRHAVIVTDVRASPLYAEWSDAVAASGINALWSTPFFSKDGRVLGTFAVYNRESHAPDAEDVRLVGRATHLASIAVEHHDTEESLRESEVRFSRAFYANPACTIITRSSDSRFLYVNDAFERMFGYSRSEALGQTALSLNLDADPDARPWLMLLDEGKLENLEVRARTKSGGVIDIVVSVERIEIRGESCTLAIAIDITERRRVEEALRRSEQLLRLVLDAIPVGVAVMNTTGDILLMNPASSRIWAGAINSGAERYVRSQGWWHDTLTQIQPHEWPSVRACVNGETSINALIDIEAFDGTRKVIQNSCVPIRDEHQNLLGAVVVNEDVSARKAAEHELEVSADQMQALAMRLMNVQDDERRRIAQMLHETTAQDLAALKMLLARLGRTSDGLSEDNRALLEEMGDLAERTMTGVRTLSYLLHPPFLDESGLLSAVRWYAQGFAQRSGIQVQLDLPATFERLRQDVETTLFRVIQEALINVYRHANSPTARIVLRVAGERLILEIEDHGAGIAAEHVSQWMVGRGSVSVGIPGMRERLKQIGGTLEIRSSDRGTIVEAVLPLSRRAS